MGIAKGVAAALAAFSMLASVPASADTMSSAEKIRRLDIMLMVTSLRCRKTADNFQADYGRFTTNQIGTLNSAANQLKGELAKRYGQAGANRALDRLSTTMANGYGQGHPWLGCAELKTVTRNLAAVKGYATLAEAADQLLAPTGSSRIAYATR